MQHHDTATGLVEKDVKHQVEHRALDIQLDQGSRAVDGFSEVNGLWAEMDFFDFGVGTHHVGWLLRKFGSIE